MQESKWETVRLLKVLVQEMRGEGGFNDGVKTAHMLAKVGGEGQIQEL